MKKRENEWAEWMRAGLAGDATAYKRLLEALTPYLRMVLRGSSAASGLGAADIEDVVQETLLAVHLKRQTWKTSEPLTPWLRAIVRNKMVDFLRKRGRGGQVQLPIDDMLETLAAPEAEPQLTPEDVGKTLKLVNGRQREVVRAIAVEGLSTAETAARLSMNEGAVRVALHRGLTAIATALRTED
ncbi:MAG: sigma-70 family RNA polymerase sigma factor [Alphaproteobacteria bacterium]